MGRRALPKIDHSVDLSQHLFDLEELTQPFVQADFFSEERHLEVEIGSGKGLFIKNAALQFPEHNFVGIERAKKYTRYAAHQLARDKVPNAIMLDGDGLKFMSDFVRADSLVGVHVYFPDPWWKERHRKRRVLKEELLFDISRTLVAGGEFHFWTDVKEYFHTSLDLIAKFSEFDGPLEVQAKQPDHDLDYRTHFERRMRMHNKPIFRSLFVKK